MSEETVTTVNNPSKKNQKNKKPKSKLQETIEFCIPIVIAVVLALILRTFVFANAVVPTGSMLNTIQEGDRIIASRLAYKNDDPQRYDIILFKYPDDESQIYVKRVIGLPGETVQIVGGVVYVTKTDGKTIQLADSFVTACVPYGDFGPYVVPKDSYFMLGDNRNDSKDSRYWTNTYVKRDKIIGKVKFRYYPSIGKIE
ncbi:MAG: signal peptidase I [Eubacterium sp.]|nr:signal peptidase I [Eubacterium sp.]MDD6567894.1 signal peptidase I [Eubacteriales bacterium]MDY4110376.1 signal peptidase I [Eubacterium sp.]